MNDAVRAAVTCTGIGSKRMEDRPKIDRDGTERIGRCLCGAVSFVGRNPPETFSICHCRMCRQWTGSALFGVSFAEEDVTWAGTENIVTKQTSDWARRGWCRECGSNLFFQFTAKGPFPDEIELPLGLFDDPNGFRLRSEIFADEAPDSYAIVDQGHRRLSRADIHAKAPIMGSAP